MRYITIAVEETTLKRLEALAEERGVTLSAIAREALDDRGRAYRPKPTSQNPGERAAGDIAARQRWDLQ